MTLPLLPGVDPDTTSSTLRAELNTLVELIVPSAGDAYSSQPSIGSREAGCASAPTR